MMKNLQIDKKEVHLKGQPDKVSLFRQLTTTSIYLSGLPNQPYIQWRSLVESKGGPSLDDYYNLWLPEKW